jgi:cob(I)alamin adenosyltransferase
VRIYTRTGDQGETSLRGGRRVRKSLLRVEAYGAVDELSACLGLAGAALGDPKTGGLLTQVQRDLFALGARIADGGKDEPPAAGKLDFPEARVSALERAIDQAEAALPPLKTFILQGGCEAGARLHFARTVCRRAERRLVALAEQEAVALVFLAYLNRLSDLLFVLARLENHRAGHAEVPW